MYLELKQFRSWKVPELGDEHVGEGLDTQRSIGNREIVNNA